MKIIKVLLDVLAPKKCYSCNKEWHFFCPQCQCLEYPFENICYYCKSSTKKYLIHDNCKNNVYYDQIIVLNHYRQRYTKNLIKDAKFNNKHHIYDDFWFYLYEKFILNHKIINKKDYFIIWVASHFFKKITRWYNWSELLAKSFSSNIKINYKPFVIIKTKNTKSQFLLTREKRLKNLNNSFVINPIYKKTLKNKTIIIVDDVISTWTTINEISKVLKNNWAKKIIWLIIASN